MHNYALSVAFFLFCLQFVVDQNKILIKTAIMASTLLEHMLISKNCSSIKLAIFIGNTSQRSLTKMNFNRQCFQVTVIAQQSGASDPFDYSQALPRPSFFVSNNCEIYRNNTHGENYFNPCKNKFSNKNYSFVCQLRLAEKSGETSFQLRTQRKASQGHSDSTQAYLVLNSKKDQQQGQTHVSEGYPLKIGDVVKFGNVQYTVCEMKHDGIVQKLAVNNDRSLGKVYKVAQCQESEVKQNLFVEVQNPQGEQTLKSLKSKKIAKQKSQAKKSRGPKRPFQHSITHFLVSNSQEQSQMINQDLEGQNYSTLKAAKALPKQAKVQKLNCRICLQNTQTAEDPLVSPCLCKGSCSYIHLQCLKQWINQKTCYKKINGVCQYFTGKNLCQICKHSLPDFFLLTDKQVPLVQCLVPQGDYVILRSQVQKTGEIKTNYVSIEGKQNRVTRIGRFEQCEVRVQDLSVSREHARIQFKDGKFYLKDCDSRYGTYIKIEGNLEFGMEAVCLQFGSCRYDIRPTFIGSSLSSDSDWDQI